MCSWGQASTDKQTKARGALSLHSHGAGPEWDLGLLKLSLFMLYLKLCVPSNKPQKHFMLVYGVDGYMGAYTGMHKHTLFQSTPCQSVCLSYNATPPASDLTSCRSNAITKNNKMSSCFCHNGILILYCDKFYSQSAEEKIKLIVFQSKLTS